MMEKPLTATAKAASLFSGAGGVFTAGVLRSIPGPAGCVCQEDAGKLDKGSAAASSQARKAKAQTQTRDSCSAKPGIQL